MKKISILLIILIIAFNITGCNVEKSPVNKKYTQDRSEQMPQVPLDDNKYTVNIINRITPIVNEGYVLSNQAQLLKKDLGDFKNEIKRIDKMLDNTNKTTMWLSELNVIETKKESKENLINALNEYEIALSSYKNLLTSEEITKEKIQNSIDNIMVSLESIKQYAK